MTCPAATAPASASQSSRGPAVPPGGRPDRQDGVGDPRADHHVHAGLQGGGDAPAAQVGVGGDHGRPRVGQRPRRCRGWRARSLGPGSSLRCAGAGRRRSRGLPGGPGPAAVASSRRRRPGLAGSRPPALVTTLMPRSRQVPSTSSICVQERPVRSHAPGSFCRGPSTG